MISDREGINKYVIHKRVKHPLLSVTADSKIIFNLIYVNSEYNISICCKADMRIFKYIPITCQGVSILIRTFSVSGNIVNVAFFLQRHKYFHNT